MDGRNCNGEYEYEILRNVHPWSKYPWRRSYVVWTIAGMSIFCYLAVTNNQEISSLLKLSCGKGFRLWQPLTACFTEVCGFNLLGFLLLQLFFGVPLEHEWSHRDLALVYIIAGCVSSLVLYMFAASGTVYASPMGAVSGMLATAWWQLRGEKVNVFIIGIMQLRTIVLTIIAAMLILCLIQGAIVLMVVPLSGFAVGLLYCHLEKILQQSEAKTYKDNKKRISKIEID
ncbi:MAG: rhomboid family intramembrane serine protease [Victivallaceae bacterium]